MAENNDGPGKRLKRQQAKYKPTPFVAKAAEDSYNYWQKNSVNGVLPASKVPKRIAIPEDEYDRKYRAMEDSLGTSYYTHSLLDQLKQGVPAADALKSLSGSFDVDHIAKPVNMSSMRKNVAPVKTIVTTDNYGQKISVPIYAQPKTFVPDKYDIKKGFWDKVGDQVSSIDRNYIDPFRQGITPDFVAPKVNEVRKTVSNFIDKWNPFSSTPSTTSASNQEGQLINTNKTPPATKPQANPTTPPAKKQPIQNILKIVAPVQRPKPKTKPKPAKKETKTTPEPVFERTKYEEIEPLETRQTQPAAFASEEIVTPVMRPVSVPQTTPMEESMMEEEVVTERPIGRKPPRAVMPRRQGGWSNQPLLMQLFPRLYQK
jgi:hypothetical protein